MPIAQAWKSLSDDGRGDFWDKRRARPLNEFIPAPQEHILAMLRGWFLGRKLGLIGKVSDGTFFVAPRGQQPGYANRELPKVLLSTSEAAGDEPAIVLESLGLAYVEVGVVNSLEPLAGYINMLELGRSGAALEDGLLSDYEQLADYVQVWIETGEITLGSGFSDPVAKAWDSSVELGTPAGRRSALKSSLEAELKMYQDEYPKYVTRALDNANYLTSAPYWPSMFWLIETSLSQLIKKL
jgi:hypothetical protein